MAAKWSVREEYLNMSNMRKFVVAVVALAVSGCGGSL